MERPRRHPEHYGFLLQESSQYSWPVRVSVYAVSAVPTTEIPSQLGGDNDVRL